MIALSQLTKKYSKNALLMFQLSSLNAQNIFFSNALKTVWMSEEINGMFLFFANMGINLESSQNK